MNNFKKDLSAEFTFNTSRSGGKGGQNVNKTETKVELLFNVNDSRILTDEEKEIINSKGRKYISEDNIFRIYSQQYRSQQRNKEDVIKKFYNILSIIFTPKKKRKKTSPSQESKELRLKGKKQKSELKQLRKKVF